jgi:3-oxoacyl-[acyl-carrier protein] reductase
MKAYSIITGGSSGIGLEIAKRLAAAGNNLIIVFRHNHENAIIAEQLLKEINSEISIHTHKFDLSNLDEVDQFLDLLSTEYKTASFNHYISCHGQIKPSLFIQKKFSSILSLMNEHLISNIKIVHGLLKKMCTQKFGRVVFISSVAAHKINQGQADYAVSKSALETFVKSMTSEYFHRNITFNCVCAGLVDTKATKEMAQDMRAHSRSEVVSAEDVSSLVEYLCGSQAKFISGATLLIDGGQLCMNNNLPYHRLSFKKN